MVKNKQYRELKDREVCGGRLIRGADNKHYLGEIVLHHSIDPESIAGYFNRLTLIHDETTIGYIEQRPNGPIYRWYFTDTHKLMGYIKHGELRSKKYTQHGEHSRYVLATQSKYHIDHPGYLGTDPKTGEPTIFPPIPGRDFVPQEA